MTPFQRIDAGDFPEGLSFLRKLELSALPRLRSVGQQAFSNLGGLQVLHLSDNPNFAVINKKAFMVLSDKDLMLEEVRRRCCVNTLLVFGFWGHWTDCTVLLISIFCSLIFSSISLT